jgi:uncharacterized protein (TIGR02058 family)
VEQRFIVEWGTGADLHGQDATKAACRAVQDAISRSCLCGLLEILRLRDLNAMRVDVLVAVPMPEQVQVDAVLSVIPFGRKTLQVVSGGMRAPGLYQPELGDRSPDIIVANAAVTVWVNQEEPRGHTEER